MGVLLRKVRKLAVMDRAAEHPSNGWTFETAGVMTHVFYLTSTRGGKSQNGYQRRRLDTGLDELMRNSFPWRDTAVLRGFLSCQS